MIDIETLDTASTAKVIQIGAVVFEPLEAPGTYHTDVFNVHIDPDQPGRTESASTLAFWESQGGVPQVEGRIPLEDALKQLGGFIDGHSISDVWSKGPSFDVAILEHAAQQHGLRPLWRFWCVKDVRTVLWLGRTRGRKANHDAVFDCIAQLTDVQECVQRLR